MITGDMLHRLGAFVWFGDEGLHPRTAQRQVLADGHRRTSALMRIQSDPETPERGSTSPLRGRHSDTVQGAWRYGRLCGVANVRSGLGLDSGTRPVYDAVMPTSTSQHEHEKLVQSAMQNPEIARVINAYLRVAPYVPAPVPPPVVKSQVASGGNAH